MNPVHVMVTTSIVHSNKIQEEIADQALQSLFGSANMTSRTWQENLSICINKRWWYGQSIIAQMGGNLL